MSTLAQVLLLVALFAVVTAVAVLGGAANLGTAMGIAQLAFTAALVALLLKR